MDILKHQRLFPTLDTSPPRGFCRRGGPLICLAAALALSSCASSPSSTIAADALMDDVGDIQVPDVMEYQIGPSDVLSITIWNHDEMNRTLTVRPDGMISFPLVGEILVVGLTPAQLQDVMESALSRYINIVEGEVSVMVDEVHSYTVSVLGRVREPGRFEFKSQATVLDALAQAGGLTDFASSSDILILRPGPEDVRRIRFDYRQVLRSDAVDGRLFVFPGDIILVP